MEYLIGKFLLFYKKCRLFGIKHRTSKPLFLYSLYSLLFLIFFISFTLDKISPFNYINIVLVVFFSIILAFFVLIHGKLYFDSFVFLLLIFLASQYVATIINLFPFFSQTGTLMVALTILLYEFHKQREVKFTTTLYIISLSGLFFLFAFTIKYWHEILNPSFSNRIGTFFGNQNDVARHFAFLSIIFLSCFFEFKHRFLKWLFFFPIVIAIYYILLTGSISNALICISIFLLVPLFKLKKAYKFIYLAILIALIALIFVILNLPSMAYFNKRLSNIINSFFGNIKGAGVDNSTILRFKGALYGFELFFKNPIFGNGYSSVYRNYVIMAHNNFAEIAADFGIVGILSYETIILSIFLKVKAKHKTSIILLLVYIFIFQLFLVSFNDKITCMVLALCASSSTFSFINNDNIVKFYHVNI